MDSMLLVFLIFGGAMYALGSFVERTIQRMVQHKRETKSASERLEEQLAQAISNVDSELNRRIDRERQDLDRRIDYVIQYQHDTACECKGHCNNKKTEA